MTPIAVRLTPEELIALDDAVRAGRFSSRSAAIRHGLRLALANDREQAILASYREGYGRFPQTVSDAGVWGSATEAGWGSLDDGDPL